MPYLLRIATCFDYNIINFHSHQASPLIPQAMTITPPVQAFPFHFKLKCLHSSIPTDLPHPNNFLSINHRLISLFMISGQSSFLCLLFQYTDPFFVHVEPIHHLIFSPSTFYFCSQLVTLRVWGFQLILELYARCFTIYIFAYWHGPLNTEPDERHLQDSDPCKLCLNVHRRSVCFAILEISGIPPKVQLCWILIYFQQTIQKNVGYRYPFLYTDFELCSADRSTLDIIWLRLCFSKVHYEREESGKVKSPLLRVCECVIVVRKFVQTSILMIFAGRLFCLSAVMGSDRETYKNLYSIRSAKSLFRRKNSVSEYNQLSQRREHIGVFW